MQLNSEIVGLGVAASEGRSRRADVSGVIQTFRLSDGNPGVRPSQSTRRLRPWASVPTERQSPWVVRTTSLASTTEITGEMLGLPLEHRGTVRSLAFANHGSTPAHRLPGRRGAGSGRSTPLTANLQAPA